MPRLPLVGIETLHRQLGTTMDVVALGLNTLLLYLIINYSSFRMKPFKGIFLLACLSDICLSGVVLLGQPVSRIEGHVLVDERIASLRVKTFTVLVQHL